MEFLEQSLVHYLEGSQGGVANSGDFFFHVYLYPAGYRDL